MVRLDLEAHEQSEHGRPERAQRQPFFLLQRRIVGIHEGGEHPRQERDRLHLRVVADLYDLEVVRAESHRDRTSDGNQRMHAERQHKQPRTHQRYEKICRRAASGQQEIIDLLRPVAVGRRMYRGRRHASEHRLGPCGRVVGMRSVPVHHLLGHALPAGDVALIDDLAVQHLRHIGV